TAPASIDTFDIASSWATILNSPVGTILLPGASTTALVQVMVPTGTFGGPVGGAAIPYGLAVDLVSGTHPVSATMIVKVFSQPLTPTTVRVVDDVTGAPLPGSLVSIEGIAATLTADAVGEVTLPLPDGPRGFFGYQSGYVAGAVSAVVGPGATIVEIRLQPGQTIQIQQIVQQQLTTAQIIARGINVMDPVNNVIVDFVVYLQIGGFPLVLPGVEIPLAPPVGTSFSFGGPCVCAGGGGSFTMGATFTQHPNGQAQTWIIIPGSAMALKQFFEATVFVVNNAVAPNPIDVQIQNAMVSLNLPSGLGLPDLNGVPQTLTQSLGNLDAGGSAQASWVVRGDIPGTYQLTGNASGDLYAFSNFVTSLSASASSEPFDVVLPQLRLEFQYPSAVTAGVPFNFGVLVTNESVAPAQHVRVSLKVENLVHCTLCPTQPMATTIYFDPFANTIRAEVVLGDIDPGQSALAQFCLVPDVSGVVTGVVIETWSSSSPAPRVVIAPAYPGSGDAQISSGVGILDGDSLHVVAPGQNAVALVESPGGTYATMPFWYVIGFFDLGASPSEGLPGLWIFGQQFYIALPMAPPFSTGRPVSFNVPASLAGLRLLSQAVFIDPATTLGYASSEAHEFIVIP
ncbi:MAG: hypothetical protein KDB53_05555, partial [Planctomycetes bacterium]|nr:hypothetical protein [Planctomycetota bacterium]